MNFIRNSARFILALILLILTSHLASAQEREWIKIAETEDPAELEKVVFKLSEADIEGYHKLLADRGIKIGDKIDGSNAEKVKGLLPDIIYDFFLKNGWNFYVRETESWSPPNRWLAATKVYHKNVKLKPDKNLENYVGGTPFPFPSVDDPDAGYKAMWNLFYRPLGDCWDLYWMLHWIDAENGVDRSQDWMAWVRPSETRLFSGKIIPEKELDDTRAIYHVGGVNPFDIAGMWTFQFKKNNGTFDDLWAYVPGSRRVRRTSFGNKQVFVGSDMINDDTMYGYSGQISWFDNAKLLGIVPMFGNLHDKLPPLEVDKDGKYKTNYLDTKNPPYWNQNGGTWEIRPMWVVEAIYNDPNYPYSRRLLWIDCETKWVVYHAMYDQKGELWKLQMNSQRGYSKDNSPYYQAMIDKFRPDATRIGWKDYPKGFIVGGYQLAVDAQAMHATSFDTNCKDHLYTDKIAEDDLTLQALQKKSH
ncbi:MAG: DUF1329 domain-containing protein [Desulfobacterales bacterium]|jgi:hypothetical protein|nr:DUF1329 domain-containing protein [Desulfobacterales bacterium]